MAEAVFRCNICNDSRVYTGEEAEKHKLETKEKGQEHNSWRMIKRQNGVRDIKEHN